MRKHIVANPLLLTIAAVAGMSYGELARGADDLSTVKDLTAVIALQGQPCGQVVEVKQQGDKDYTATCQDGKRYHVFINAAGRVVVQKQ